MSEEETEPTGSRNAGVAVLAAAALALGGGLYLVTDAGLILVVWAVGWWAVVRAAKKVPGAPNPAPPSPSERGAEENTQVSIVRDTTHPNRWTVARPSPWMTYEPTDRDGT